MQKLTQLILGAGLWITQGTVNAADPQTPPAPPVQATPGVTSAASPAAPPAVPDAQQTSYLFGLTFGEQLHSVGITNQVDIEAITRGIKAGIQGVKSTRADQQQIQTFVRDVISETTQRNKTAARAFLDHNAHGKGIKSMADGLQYRVLAPGNAKAPVVAPTDEVTVNYSGKLIDGAEFDSSYTRGTPATFKVNGVIKGWQEALVLMKPGAKWQLFVPPELAYDASPRPGIPAGSLLIFDVELLSAKPSAALAAPPTDH